MTKGYNKSYKTPHGIPAYSLEEERRRAQVRLKKYCSICQGRFQSKEKIVFCQTAVYVYHVQPCFAALNKNKCRGCCVTTAHDDIL